MPRRDSFSADGHSLVLASLEVAFASLAKTVGNRKKALSYLLKGSLKKSNIKRFLAWMLCLDILPDNKAQWAGECFNIWIQYKSKMINYLGSDNEDPLSQLPQNEAYLVSSDLSRTASFFNKLAASINLNSQETESAFFHTSRVFSLMILSDPTFSYTQGCDRYVYTVYLLSILFAKHFDLPLSFAEAATFVIATKLMELSNITHYLKNPQKIESHFQELDKKFMQINGNLMQQYASRGQSSVFFALRWEILMFADEHDFNGLTLIWDQIISRKKYYPAYIEALCCAHFAQAPEGQINALQHFRQWDYKKLLTDADIQFNSGNIFASTWKTCAICALAGVLFIGQAMFH